MLFQIVLIATGLVLAFAGRRLIWLLIAALGFVLGYSLVGLLLPGVDELVQLAVGLLAGLVFALLTTRFTRLLLNLAGFILAGGLALTLANALGVASGLPSLLAFVIGGLVGIGFVSIAFELSLIVLSALGGAALVVQALPSLVGGVNQQLAYFAGIVVAVLGFLVQWQAWRKH